MSVLSVPVHNSSVQVFSQFSNDPCSFCSCSVLFSPDFVPVQYCSVQVLSQFRTDLSSFCIGSVLFSPDFVPVQYSCVKIPSQFSTVLSRFCPGLELFTPGSGQFCTSYVLFQFYPGSVPVQFSSVPAPLASLYTLMPVSITPSP